MNRRDLVQRARRAAHQLQVTAADLAHRHDGRDPGRLAERLARALARRRYVLAASHTDYLVAFGGIELQLAQEQRFAGDEGLAYLQLSPAGAAVRVRVDGRPLGAHGAEALAAALRLLVTGGHECAALHLHHLLGWPLDRLAELVAAAAPRQARFFAHDYYALCANYNLLRDGQQFCGAPPIDSPTCRSCQSGAQRREHVVAIAQFLDGVAARVPLSVVAPSEVARSWWTIGRPSADEPVRVVPHQRLVQLAARTVETTAPRRRSLGFVGYESRAKGSVEWERVISTPTLHHAYRFLHFGAIARPRPQVEHVPASVQLDGPDAMRAAIAGAGLELAFLWSICPETFSFTCHEALAAGAFVLTHADSGNIRALVEATGRGRVFATLESVLAFLHDRDEVERALAEHRRRAPLGLAWERGLMHELGEHA
jgi:hypothetical protein